MKFYRVFIHLTIFFFCFSDVVAINMGQALQWESLNVWKFIASLIHWFWFYWLLSGSLLKAQSLISPVDYYLHHNLVSIFIRLGKLSEQSWQKNYQKKTPPLLQRVSLHDHLIGLWLEKWFLFRSAREAFWVVFTILSQVVWNSLQYHKTRYLDEALKFRPPLPIPRLSG